MRIVSKVGIVSDLFSDTKICKLRHCLLMPFFKDFFFFFFSGYTVVIEQQIERRLFVLVHTSAIFRTHIDKFSTRHCIS